MDWFVGAESKHLKALAHGLSTGTMTLPGTGFKLTQLQYPQALQAAALETLGALKGEGWSAAQVGRCLEALAAERARTERRRDDIELVWSGPDAPGAESRDAARALEELFARASTRVLLAGYNVQPGRHFTALREAMLRHPAMEVELYTHVFVDEGDASIAQHLVTHEVRMRDVFGPKLRARVRLFRPSMQLLELAVQKKWHMHAKCVSVDDRHVLITSANFSYTAQERNVEVGVTLDDPLVAQRLRWQFDTLVKRGHMVAQAAG